MSAEFAIPYDKTAHESTIRAWWEHYYGDTFPDCLPDAGGVAMHEGKPAAVAFLHTGNGKIALIDFLIGDPELRAGRRLEKLNEAAEKAFIMAKEFLDGRGIIVSITDHPVVAKIFEKQGMFCAPEEKVFFMAIGKKSCDFLK